MPSLDATLINSIVGTGSFFKGNIVVSGLLRIDGDFSGGIKTAGRVIIGRGGRADCTIDASTVVIGGIFRGTVYASEKVIALDTAVIIGNIYSPRIIVESGVILDGAMHIRGVRDERESGTEKAPVDTAALPPTDGRSRRSWRQRRPRSDVGVPDRQR